MHELFTKVLAKRDLSRAGDLFSVPDAEIVNDITEVVSSGAERERESGINLIPIEFPTACSSRRSIRSSRMRTT